MTNGFVLSNEEMENLMADKTILQEAHEIIYGDREEAYGDPALNLNKIARYWWAHVENMEPGHTLDANDVCMMMAMLKFARQTHKEKRDNLVDAAGYVALIERIS